MVVAERIVANDFAAFLLVFLDLGQTDDCGAEVTLDPERVDNFFDHAGCSSNLDVLVTDGAVFV